MTDLGWGHSPVQLLASDAVVPRLWWGKWVEGGYTYKAMFKILLPVTFPSLVLLDGPVPAGQHFPYGEDVEPD